MSSTASRWTRYQWAIVGVLAAAEFLSAMDRVNIAVVVPVFIRSDHLSPAAAGWLLSAFSWVYLVCLLLAGPLADRFGPKLLAIGMAIWSVATLLTGVVARLGVLIFARGLLGVGEAPLYPVQAKIVSRVIEPTGRSKALGTAIAGYQIGLLATFPFAALLLHVWGWASVFYVTGVLSLLWLLLWRAVYRAGGKHPDLMPRQEPVQNRPGLLSLLRYRATWGIMVGQFGFLYILFIFGTWFPSYLVLQRHMTVLRSGLVSALPFVAAALAMVLGGWVGDRWIKAGASLTLSRKTVACGGLFCCGVLIALGAVTQGTTAAVTMFVLSFAFFGFSSAAVNTIPLDLAPQYIVSSLTSLQNVAANLGGALAPVVTGYLLASTGNFRLPLLVAAGVAILLGSGGYGLLLGKVEQSVAVPDRPLAAGGAEG